MRKRKSLDRKEKKLVVIKTDGSIDEFIMDKAPELKRLQEIVGGYIEVVPVLYGGNHVQMIVDDEGLVKQKSINEKATDIYRRTRDGFPLIAGDVAILVGLKLE